MQSRGSGAVAANAVYVNEVAMFVAGIQIMGVILPVYVIAGGVAAR